MQATAGTPATASTSATENMAVDSDHATIGRDASNAAETPTVSVASATSGSTALQRGEKKYHGTPAAAS
jgi:hypothetical protein